MQYNIHTQGRYNIRTKVSGANQSAVGTYFEFELTHKKKLRVVCMFVHNI